MGETPTSQFHITVSDQGWGIPAGQLEAVSEQQSS